MLLLGLGVWAALRPRKSVGQPAWRLSVRDTDAFMSEVGMPPGDTLKRANMEALAAKKRNTNLDVIPGVGRLIRGMAQHVVGKKDLGHPWDQADAYYDGTSNPKMPSYETLTKLVDKCPPCPERDEAARILRDHYAWDSIVSIEPHTCHRVDCQVAEEHAFVGNGLVNHNTWLFVFAIWGARANGLRSLILENTDELIEQTVEKLKRIGVNPGVIKAGKNQWTSDVVVASVQTLSKSSRLFNLPPNHFGLVITDEAHYANAPSYQKVLYYFGDAWHLGVTATPFRGDKRSLAGAGWHVVSYVYTMQQAVKDGWLAPVKFVRVDTGVKLAGLKKSRATITSTADFNAKILERMINTPARNDAIVRAALEHMTSRISPLQTKMRRTLAFCAGVDHAVDLANAFRRQGIEAFPIYGSMKEKHRRMILQAHRMDKFPVLTNCNILTHGYDDPGLEGIIMARPTESKVLYLQELGRGLRKSPETGKTDCVCLDVVDVVSKHALTIGPELMALEEAMKEEAGPGGVKPEPVLDRANVPGQLNPTDAEGFVPKGAAPPDDPALVKAMVNAPGEPDSAVDDEKF